MTKDQHLAVLVHLIALYFYMATLRLFFGELSFINISVGFVVWIALSAIKYFIKS